MLYFLSREGEQNSHELSKELGQEEGNLNKRLRSLLIRGLVSRSGKGFPWAPYLYELTDEGSQCVKQLRKERRQRARSMK